MHGRNSHQDRNRIWRNSNIRLILKYRLYKSSILPVLLSLKDKSRHSTPRTEENFSVISHMEHKMNEFEWSVVTAFVGCQKLPFRNSEIISDQSD